MNENKHINHDSQHPHLLHRHHQWNDSNRDELSAGRRDRAIRKEYGREIEEEVIREQNQLDDQEAALRSIKDKGANDENWEEHWDEKARKKLRDPPSHRSRMEDPNH
eukprot:TRINITY_DN13137_c0_g1_i1.p2 TRINITY_DN13137_c0_g1~~TRINITY_DN13137_c0_g1_i1.p2  ORF type:complete len:107 (+),score=23.52 TRINITY_DN13137_c0_g1_i1:456-776(+)